MTEDEVQDLSQALSESEKRYRAVLETAVNAIIVMGQDRLIRLVNSAAEQMFGYRKEEMVGQNIKMLMPSPYQEEHDSYVDNYVGGGRRKIIGIGREVLAMHKDGSTFPIHLSVGEAELAEGKLFTGIILDLSEKKRLERSLLEVSEEEQRRIGRDLHDDICQQLAGIGCLLKVLKQQYHGGGSDLADGLEEVERLVRDTNARAREIARGLVPVVLESEGLRAALAELASSTSHLFGVDCHLIAPDDAGSTIADPQMLVHLFRIAQEAIRNAVTHGGAQIIELRLDDRGGRIALTIRDNGHGLDPGGQSASSGMGLITMEHRAKMMSGRLRIEDREGGGLTLRCEVPLP